jgi:F0F1-type ATP synthase membrane subunit c/vacuolar-type H+-ATPase subunit K
VVSLFGWIIFRHVFQDDADDSARFATRFFLGMTVVEVVVYIGVVYAVYRMVVTGNG